MVGRYTGVEEVVERLEGTGFFEVGSGKGGRPEGYRCWSGEGVGRVGGDEGGGGADDQTVGEGIVGEGGDEVGELFCGKVRRVGRV